MSTNNSNSPLLSLAPELQDIIFEGVFDAVTHVSGDDYRAPALLRALRTDSHARKSFISAHDIFYKTAIFEIDHTHLVQRLQSRNKRHVCMVKTVHLVFDDGWPSLDPRFDPNNMVALALFAKVIMAIKVDNIVRGLELLKEQHIDSLVQLFRSLGGSEDALQVKLCTANGKEVWTSSPVIDGINLLLEAGYLNQVVFKNHE